MLVVRPAARGRAHLARWKDAAADNWFLADENLIEVLQLHLGAEYEAWRERFEANWDKAAELYDERFCRMWEFYLCACEVSFLHGNNMVFQLMLSLERDAVPIVRDFIVDNEKDLREKASKIRKTA